MTKNKKQNYLLLLIKLQERKLILENILTIVLKLQNKFVKSEKKSDEPEKKTTKKNIFTTKWQLL